MALDLAPLLQLLLVITVYVFLSRLRLLLWLVRRIRNQMGNFIEIEFARHHQRNIHRVLFLRLAQLHQFIYCRACDLCQSSILISYFLQLHLTVRRLSYGFVVEKWHDIDLLRLNDSLGFSLLRLVASEYVHVLVAITEFPVASAIYNVLI